MGRRVKRKNPVGYGVPLLIPVAAVIIGGGAVVGGAYVYNAMQIDVKQYDADVVLKNAAEIIATIQDGFTSDDPDPMTAFLGVKGLTTSAIRSPPTERGAYAQAAIYLAVASAMDGGNKELLGKAEEFFAGASSASTDATESFPFSQKVQPLKDAMQILVETQNKRFYPVVQRLMFLAREEGVQDTVSDVKKYSTSTLGKEALDKTTGTVFAPFKFAAALLSGENPFNIPDWQWKAIRWTVIIGGGYAVFNLVAGRLTRDVVAVGKAAATKRVGK